MFFVSNFLGHLRVLIVLLGIVFPRFIINGVVAPSWI